MNIFPYDKFEINTSLSINEALSKINESIVPPNRNSDKDFEGQVDRNEFEFSRILKSGRNSFIPIVNGKVKDSINGCTVKVTIRLNYAVYLLMTFFILFDLSLIYFSFNWSNVFFLAIAYLLPTFFFNIETNTVKVFLKRLEKQS